MTSTLVLMAAIILNTVNKLYTKFILGKVDSFSLLIFVNIVSAVLALPLFIFYRGEILSLSAFQLIFVFVTCAFWPLNGYLGNLSVEKAEVSVREPVSQLQIVWGVLIGLFVFNDMLSNQQIMGILFIIAGSLVLVFKRKIFEIEITKSGMHIVLVYTVFTAIVASMDKYLLSFLRPELYLFFNFMIPTLFLIPFIKYNKHNLINSFKYKKEIIIVSLIFFVTYLSTLYSYKNFDFSISYPLLKIATPLTAIMAIFIFNEKNNLNKKIIAITLVCIGALLMKVSF